MLFLSRGVSHVYPRDEVVTDMKNGYCNILLFVFPSTTARLEPYMPFLMFWRRACSQAIAASPSTIKTSCAFLGVNHRFMAGSKHRTVYTSSTFIVRVHAGASVECDERVYK